jgi:hypothetical protein
MPVFVKPVLPKQFIGQVWNSILQLIPIANIPDSAEVWVCEPLDIVSEFRVYVQDGEILGVKHYWGEWNVTPSEDFIKTVIRVYKDAPLAYGVDIAVTRNPDKDIVMEVNDGCNLGNYGLDAIHYGEMIVARWFDIMEKGGKGAELRTESLKNYAAEIYEKVSVGEDGALKVSDALEATRRQLQRGIQGRVEEALINKGVYR